MKLIIPMAGMGKRMRPHTLTVPKPLIKIAGKPIVQRLVEEITKVVNETPEEVAFIIGDFGKEVEDLLHGIGKKMGFKTSVYYQYEALGTAHAINCAAESLSGNVIVAFADTLFHTGFSLDKTEEANIWVNKVNNPSLFGVVELDNEGFIKAFYEKPKKFISDLAIVGVYYFRDGEKLRKYIEKLISENNMKNGEFQLTDVLQEMMETGVRFSAYHVEEWLDCGNKDATVHTNQRILEHSKNDHLVATDLVLENAIIIQPCFIDKGVKIAHSIIGPHVSVGAGTKIDHCIISNSIIQSEVKLHNANIDNSMIGNHAEYREAHRELNMGDFSNINQ